MVNPLVYNFLKDNFDSQDTASLRNIAVSRGYSSDDFDLALQAVKNESLFRPKRRMKLMWLSLISALFLLFFSFYYFLG